MAKCFQCGSRLRRIHRTLTERFRYSAVYRCPECEEKRVEDQWFLFFLGKVSRCPYCGTHRLQKLRRIDHIDPMYRNPISYFQKFFGAELHRCSFCRLQFYDCRGIADFPKVAAVTGTATRDE